MTLYQFRALMLYDAIPEKELINVGMYIHACPQNWT